MSAQFGMIRFDHQPIPDGQLREARAHLSPYGPDSDASLFSPEAAILYRGFHITKESCGERQPYTLMSGEVLTWTGRLDNRDELFDALQLSSASNIADGTLAALMYERVGVRGFGRLVGDWTCSVWNAREHRLILAVDSIGVGRLYYRHSGASVSWSTCLEALVPDIAREHLDEEYVAGWLSMFPAEYLTPYQGVRAVPAASYVIFQWEVATLQRYWSFDGAKEIRYASDSDYEEHFRTIFKLAVRRRLRAMGPIVAELSGGMDSSSIVCTADLLKQEHECDDLDLHTISYHNEEEPTWDEFPYFSLIEQRRGRTGRHVNLTGKIVPGEWSTSSRTLPGVLGSLTSLGRGDFLHEIGARVLLSGIGGDEVTGGVPTPTPELANHLSAFRFRTLAHRLTIWAIETRRPWIHLFAEVIAAFLPTRKSHRNDTVPDWLQNSFKRNNEKALSGYRAPCKLFGPRPSFQEGVAAIAFLSRQLACVPIPSNPVYERRYPFLDRDLLDFLLAIPREQVVRPGQRRSLLRRALRNIVPDEVLDRRCKAFVARSSTVLLAAESERLARGRMHLACLGIVEPEQFHRAVEKIRVGKSQFAAPLLRALILEDWISTAGGFSLTAHTN